MFANGRLPMRDVGPGRQHHLLPRPRPVRGTADGSSRSSSSTSATPAPRARSPSGPPPTHRVGFTSCTFERNDGATLQSSGLHPSQRAEQRPGTSQGHDRDGWDTRPGYTCDKHQSHGVLVQHRVDYTGRYTVLDHTVWSAGLVATPSSHRVGRDPSRWWAKVQPLSLPRRGRVRRRVRAPRQGGRRWRRGVSLPARGARRQGGPDGGDGGTGGDVWLVADRNVASLLALPGPPAPPGGERRPRHGQEAATARRATTSRSPSPRAPSSATRTAAVLADLVHDGDRWLAAEGGRGGRGNARFLSQPPAGAGVRRAGRGGRGALAAASS